MNVFLYIFEQTIKNYIGLETISPHYGCQSVPEPAIEFSMKWTDLFKAVQSIGVTNLWSRKESDQYKFGKNKDSIFWEKALSSM